nr:uncharacterized protein LOC109418730 [Aedes albopictus]
MIHVSDEVMSPSDKTDQTQNLREELTNLKENLRQSQSDIEYLKEKLNEMALSKQYLINDLHQTIFINDKLSRKLSRQRHYFTEENELLKLEMERIKLYLQSQQRSLHASNRKIARHMRGCAGTRFRLGEMFLRMRSTKRRYERRRNRYQQMCLEFAANVREQNRYMLAAVEAKLSNESITTCHRQYLDLLTRCSQLLHENMNLRLLAMNKLDEEERPPHKVRAEVVEISEPDHTSTGSDETIFKTYIKTPKKQRRQSV